MAQEPADVAHSCASGPTLSSMSLTGQETRAPDMDRVDRAYRGGFLAVERISWAALGSVCLVTAGSGPLAFLWPGRGSPGPPAPAMLLTHVPHLGDLAGNWAGVCKAAVRNTLERSWSLAFDGRMLLSIQQRSFQLPVVLVPFVPRVSMVKKQGR